MTEEEWLTCERPEVALRFLHEKATERKARLFGCAECRQRWDVLYHHRSRSGLEVAERFADADASDDEIQTAFYYAEVPTFGHDHDGTWRELLDGRPVPEEILRLAELGVLSPTDFTQIESTLAAKTRRRIYDAANLVYYTCADNPLVAFVRLREFVWSGMWLVRDIFGNPFRPVAFDPAWRTDTATALARTMYDQREFGAMPILADALQDAGCDNAEILHHCRSDGPHVRGCWVVDLVLGKE